jgi:hypothetical protein
MSIETMLATMGKSVTPHQVGVTGAKQVRAMLHAGGTPVTPDTPQKYDRTKKAYESGVRATMGKVSAYWLIDAGLLTTHAPPSTFEEVQAMYPMRAIESPSGMPRNDVFNLGDDPKVAILRNRLEALRGVFYDADEIQKARQVMSTDEGLREVALCVLNAERIIDDYKALRKEPCL